MLSLSRLLFLLADVLGTVCMARLLLQWARLDYRHPLAQFCVRTTNWLIQPLRRLVPPLGRWDTACLVAVFVVYYLAGIISVLLHSSISGINSTYLIVNGLLSLLLTLKATAYALLFGLILLMMLNFSQTYTPLMAVLRRLFNPITRPFAFLRFRQWDFSATVLVLVLWLWLSVWLPECIEYLNILLMQQ